MTPSKKRKVPAKAIPSKKAQQNAFEDVDFCIICMENMPSTGTIPFNATLAIEQVTQNALI